MDPSQLRDLLRHSNWKSNFDTRTLSRAGDYARRGKVIELNLDGDGDDLYVLQGRVSGSGRNIYGCSIGIESDGGRLILDTDCSCPVAVGCKHAAAMLLTAMDSGSSASVAPANPNRRAPVIPAWLARLHEEEPPPQIQPAKFAVSEWERWLQTLQPAAVVNYQAEPQRTFGVLLRGDDQHPVPSLLALPAWLRPPKSKTRHDLVDPQPLHLHERHGAVPMPADGWTVEAAAALVTLVQRQSERFSNQLWTPIRAAYEEQALERLLRDHPVWYERGSAPLQRGPALALELYWRESSDGSQRLAAGVGAADETLLLRGAGLWYVQPGAGRYGRVDGDTRTLEQLPYAPALQPEHVALVRERLQLSAAPCALPEPIERGPVERIRVAPIPVLSLRAVTLTSWNGKRREVGIGRLTFDYAGVALAPNHEQAASTRVMQGERLLVIQRDNGAERNANRLLDALGAMRIASAQYEYNLNRYAFDIDDLALRPNQRKPVLAPHDWQPTIEKLGAAGLRIDYDASFPHDQLLDIDAWHAELAPRGNAWFDVSLGIDVGGQRIDLLPILRRVLADPAFPRVAPKSEKKNAVYRVSLDETRSIEIPLQRLRALIEPLLEWLEGDGELRVHRSQAPALRELADQANLVWHGGEALRAQLELLGRAPRSVKAPRGFNGTLRPYQREGLAWLDFLGHAGLGGILADDMGLGKTVQVLAHILGAKQRGQLDAPVLVVAPTSLIDNWRDEAARFAPQLKTLIIHGADRAEHYADVADHDLIITTYPLLPRDRDQLLEARFSLLVLDEAQAIKNPRSQAARVAREIPATRRLAMTGTPLENHLGELWAQFDAVEPGLLGSERQFTRLYRTPIEKHGDGDRQQRLNRRIGPLLLRRRKDQVLTDLPAKNEIVRTLELEGGQRSLYETLRLTQHERIRQAIKRRGLAQAGIIVLDALLKLRQACCDPRLVKLPSAKKVQGSAKLEALLELLDGLLGEGRRILLFSQFTEMLALIESALNKRRVDYQILTGQTPAKTRGALVKRFQKGDVPVFLISLKAGGVGLNLTAADTVIHYDPWWNPAVEAQATDRAHRIGQHKPVFVYRLICAGTVEEKIQALQARKAELARAVLEGGATQRLRFDEADLAELFAPL